MLIGAKIISSYKYNSPFILFNMQKNASDVLSDLLLSPPLEKNKGMESQGRRTCTCICIHVYLYIYILYIYIYTYIHIYIYTYIHVLHT
jgi:hypothetical protein